MKILIIDISYSLYDKIVDVELEILPYPTNIFVWKILSTIKDNYFDWFWQEELIENITYIDLDKHPNLKAFI